MQFDRENVSLSPAELHHADFDSAERLLVVPELGDDRTLVLGSTQPESDVDHGRCAELGVEVARRRSGGGAVLVSRHDLVWVDLVIPATDPLWEHDVAVAFEWVGRALQEALASLGQPTRMHRGALVSAPWSKRICFAGVGPGELLADDDRKVVGISQRRTRAQTRFQVAILRRWSGAEHAELFVDGDESDAAELDRAAVGIDDDPPAILEAVEAALRTVDTSSRLP